MSQSPSRLGSVLQRTRHLQAAASRHPNLSKGGQAALGKFIDPNILGGNHLNPLLNILIIYCNIL